MYEQRFSFYSEKGRRLNARSIVDIFIISSYWFLICYVATIYADTTVFFFLGPHLQHVEFPRLGIESELQGPAYTTATAMPDLSHICDLHYSSWQCWILNSLKEARDRTHVLMDTSQILFRCTKWELPDTFLNQVNYITHTPPKYQPFQSGWCECFVQNIFMTSDLDLIYCHWRHCFPSLPGILLWRTEFRH